MSKSSSASSCHEQCLHWFYLEHHRESQIPTHQLFLSKTSARPYLFKQATWVQVVHQATVKSRGTWQDGMALLMCNNCLDSPHYCQGEAEWHLFLDKTKEKREIGLWNTNTPPPSPVNRISTSEKKPWLTGFSCSVPLRHNAKGPQAMGEGSVYWSMRSHA